MVIQSTQWTKKNLIHKSGVDNNGHYKVYDESKVTKPHYMQLISRHIVMEIYSKLYRNKAPTQYQCTDVYGSMSQR